MIRTDADALADPAVRARMVKLWQRSPETWRNDGPPPPWDHSYTPALIVYALEAWLLERNRSVTLWRPEVGVNAVILGGGVFDGPSRLEALLAACEEGT